MPASPIRDLPLELAALGELALDLRWTWSHEADALWERVDAEVWGRTRNPWTMLQDVSAARLRALAADRRSSINSTACIALAEPISTSPAGFPPATAPPASAGVAYFSMEFGLGDALPLYAGGLGMLAGDLLKTASDLGIPVSRHRAALSGRLFPADASTPPAGSTKRIPTTSRRRCRSEPAQDAQGQLAAHRLDLPGRTVQLRVWQARSGAYALYLLDSQRSVQQPGDRGITGKLYGAGSEIRLLQEIVLGVGGWRAVEALRPEIEICHLNEGHAAFAVLERARAYDATLGPLVSGRRCGRRGPATFSPRTRRWLPGFDRFPPATDRQIRALRSKILLAKVGVDAQDFWRLGRASTGDDAEPFNMAYLAVRGSLHELRRQPAAWPGQPADFPAAVPALAGARGAGRSCHQRRARADLGFSRAPTISGPRPAARSGGEACPMRYPPRSSRPVGRRALGDARRGPAGAGPRASAAGWPGSCASRGHPPRSSRRRRMCSIPMSLTLGFARRFTDYKRPNLLLRDPARLAPPAERSARPVADRGRRQGPSGRRGGQEHDPGMDRSRAAARRSADASCFSRITTSRSRRSWCRAWMSGSTRRAGRGRPAAPAA